MATFFRKSIDAKIDVVPDSQWTGKITISWVAGKTKKVVWTGGRDDTIRNAHDIQDMLLSSRP